MKKTLFLLLLFPVLVFGNAIWGKTGHRVTGQIAQNYLTGKAKRALNDLLDGHSLAFVSTFANDKSGPELFQIFGMALCELSFGNGLRGFGKE